MAHMIIKGWLLNMFMIKYYLFVYKRILSICLIVIIFAIIIFINKENIYKQYKINEMSNEVIDVLNGKFDNKISERTKFSYKRYNMSLEDLNHYDITKLIEAYISEIKESVNLYLMRKAGNEKEEGGSQTIIDKDKDFEYGKDIKMSYHSMLKYAFSYDITEEDVDNYNKGIFVDLLIEKLKKCLDYEVIGGKIKWEINSIEDRIIDLPYNTYIEYKAYKRQRNKDFKRAIRVLNKNSNSYDSYMKYNKIGSRFYVEYETVDGVIKKRKFLW